MRKPTEIDTSAASKPVEKRTQEPNIRDSRRGEALGNIVAVQAKPRRVGTYVRTAEAVLDERFANSSISPETLALQTNDPALSRGELRATHLVARLEIKPVLSQYQKMINNNARGYGTGTHSSHPSHASE